MSQRRVVITGMGVVSPLGSSLAEFWESIVSGASGIGDLSKLDAALYPRPRSAEVRGYDSVDEHNDESLKPFGQAVGYTIAATRMALDNARLDIDPDTPNDYAVMVGTTMGNQDVVERTIDLYGLTEEDDTHPEMGTQLQFFSPALLSSEVAKRFSCYGQSATLVNACAAGNYTVGLAFDRIRSGRNKVILAGGADPFSRTCYTIFHRLSASSADVCRPFDKDRTGMIVGEGAAMLVLEDYEHAVERGAHIYAEVTGYALNCDAYHATAPHPEGRGAIQAMQRALDMAGLTPGDIQYICAHGTGTQANDSSEAEAMFRVFDKALANVPVSSIKSMLGHCMGAASALEAVSCALALEHQKLPPTLNTEAVDPDFPFPLDVVPNRSRPAKLSHIMSNAFAFGGNVSCVIFSKPSQPLGVH
ncbi:beta-ketoacyl-[acyl-carrier-protein] synthase family protein [Zobellella sp. DQSA1]|uniref:beta-ketoacyl-[acyl-carrier-protein] synthase family protein n=1 Tax=Zobellella sp. DQSA1 TaxID=3342386 RepID=UPI0035C05BF2